MTIENNYFHAFKQLVTVWAVISQEVTRTKGEFWRVKERAQWEAKWAAIIGAIDQLNVPQPLEILSRHYLDLELELRQKSDHDFQEIIRIHQQRMFDIICVSITAHGLASETVETLAILAQACTRERESADASQQSADFLAYQRDVTEALWASLKPMLMAMIFSRGWVASWEKVGIFDNDRTYATGRSKAETLALIGFAHILDHILTPKLDLDRNIPALLTTIAHRGIRAEYQVIRGQETVPLTASPELVDTSLTEEILERMDDQQIHKAIRQYVDQELKPVEQWIFRRRWLDQPPASSATIAEELGEGWNENRVNVAHHRILKKIRQHLHSLILDDQQKAVG
jgi:hypothetical protein